MSTWTTPATWSNGAVTATQMNTEIRDHLNWLKGALDLITGSSASDTGTATRLAITRTAGTDNVLTGKVSGDAANRVEIWADGSINLGPASGPTAKIKAGTNAGDIDITAISGAQQLNLDRLHINGGSSGGYIEWVERTTPPGTPSGVNQAVMYCEDNGSGKTRIVIKWGAGTTTVLATQP
jgi:hypothetical protein